MEQKSEKESAKSKLAEHEKSGILDTSHGMGTCSANFHIDLVCFVFIDMMLQKGEKKEIYAENQLKQAYLLKRTCKTRDLTAEKFK